MELFNAAAVLELLFYSFAEVILGRFGAHQGGHATTRFLEGFLEGSLKEVIHARVLRRPLVRVSRDRGSSTGSLKRTCHRRRSEGA